MGLGVYQESQSSLCLQFQLLKILNIFRVLGVDIIPLEENIATLFITSYISINSMT